jgi:hypothetical protein
LGGFFVYSAILSPFDRPRKPTTEFRDDLPMFVWAWMRSMEESPALAHFGVDVRATKQRILDSLN